MIPNKKRKTESDSFEDSTSHSMTQELLERSNLNKAADYKWEAKYHHHCHQEQQQQQLQQQQYSQSKQAGHQGIPTPPSPRSQSPVDIPISLQAQPMYPGHHRIMPPQQMAYDYSAAALAAGQQQMNIRKNANTESAGQAENWQPFFGQYAQPRRFIPHMMPSQPTKYEMGQSDSSDPERDAVEIPFPGTDRRFREIIRDNHELAFVEIPFSMEDSPEPKRDYADVMRQMAARLFSHKILEDDVSEIRDKDKLHKDDRHVPDVFTTNPYYLKLYNEAISKGEEKDSSIRINVVGNFGQGKTTLTKRLLQQTTEGVKSTNSVEINHCKYEYMQDEIAFSKKMEDEDDIIGRIAYVAHSKMMRDGQDESSHSDKSFDKDPTWEKFETISEEKNNEQQLETISEQTDESVKTGDQSLTSPKLRQELSRIEKSSISLSERNKFTMLLQNSQNKDVARRDLDIWDFGGQFSFYATHNLFHSRRAVYLLVFDLSKPLSSVVEDSEFPDRDEEKTMEQYAKFWINSIHAYVGTDDGTEPPVILVGTHKDKLKGDEHAKQEFIEEYFEQIRKLFENTNMIRHIQPADFAVDNTNQNDNGIVILRKEVIQQGTKLAEISIPAKWIPLEREVRRHRHEKIISFEQLMDIDSRNEFPLKEEEQVKLFLRYHHSKGTLLYYDEEPISAYVVLDAQFLIDAFKCIITSKRFCRNDHTCRTLWNMLTREAQLENELIDTLWIKDTLFYKHKKELLMFLEKHLIISEASVYCEESQKSKGLGWYIVPSLLRNNRTEDILTEFLKGRRRTSVRFVMSFYQSPLVQILFYRFLAALIGKWPIMKIPVDQMPSSRAKGEEKALIYENLGVFELDDNHAGIVVHKYDDIDIWVLSLRPSENVSRECVDRFRRFCESTIKNEFVKFRHSRTTQENLYTIGVKCNDECHGPSGGAKRVPLDDIHKKRSKRACPDKRNHEIYPDAILSEWFLEDKIKLLCPDHLLNDKELGEVSSAIGKNWEFLGIKLGLGNAQLDQLTMDNSTSEMKIYTMLLKWKAEKEDGATINALIHAMETEKRVYVEWDNIRNIIDKINSERQEN